MGNSKRPQRTSKTLQTMPYKAHTIAVVIAAIIVAGTLIYLKAHTEDLPSVENFDSSPYGPNGSFAGSPGDLTSLSKIISSDFSEFIGKSVQNPNGISLMDTLNTGLLAKNFSIVTEGPVTVSNDQSIVLDLFVFNKTSNYIVHLLVILSKAATDAKGSRTGSSNVITGFAFPDLEPSSSVSQTNGNPVTGPSRLAAFKQLSIESDDITEVIYDGYKGASKMTSTGSDTGLCFGSVAVGSKTKEDCEKYNGIWDSPVSNGSDCPYYQANKNFPNELGSVNNGGYCNLPRGLQLVGFRNVSTAPSSKALCYSCKDTESPLLPGDCCEDQKDPIKYPELKGPDYAFIGDTEVRAGVAMVNPATA